MKIRYRAKAEGIKVSDREKEIYGNDLGIIGIWADDVLKAHPVEDYPNAVVRIFETKEVEVEARRNPDLAPPAVECRYNHVALKANSVLAECPECSKPL